MKKLKKWFLNLSIQRKYLYCTLGITLVVLLATSFFQFMSASEIVTEQTVKQSAGVINELSVNLDHYFDMVENSFEYIANNSIVQAELESDLALIAVVGRGMRATRGTSGRIFSALAHANVNVKMIDQGSSELNIIIGVRNHDFDAAIKAIYDIFVNTRI